MRLLLENRWAPVTSEIGFLECGCEAAAEGVMWLRRNLYWFVRTHMPHVRPASGSLEQMLPELLPLSDMTDKWLLVPTQRCWTACFTNDAMGNGPGSLDSLAAHIGCRSIRICCKPETLSQVEIPPGGPFHSAIFDVHDANGCLERSVYLSRSDRWEFHESGRAYDFEHTDRYSAKRARDRFDPELLVQYLDSLGLRPFDEDFYLASEENPAHLVWQRISAWGAFWLTVTSPLWLLLAIPLWHQRIRHYTLPQAMAKMRKMEEVGRAWRESRIRRRRR